MTADPGRISAAATRALDGMTYVRDADLSPDGRHVAWCAAAIDGDVERLAIRVTKVGADEPSELAFGGRDHDAVWSPDSRRLALVSEGAGGGDRVLIVSPEDGSVETAVPVPRRVAGRPAWSPDGRFVAFATSTSAPRDTSRPYRVSRAIPWLDGLGLVDDNASDICVLDVAAAQWRPLTRDAWVNTAPAWLAGSTGILYLASSDPGDWDRSHRLRSVSLDGVVQDLARSTDFVSAGPLPGPGARAAVTSHGVGPTGSLGRLFVTGPDGTLEDRSSALGLDINGSVLAEIPVPFANYWPHLIVDGDDALVRIQVRDRIEIHRVGLSGPLASSVVLAGERCGYPLAVAAGKLLYGSGTVTAAPDLWVRDFRTGEETRVTCTEAANAAVLTKIAVEDFLAHAPGGPDVQVKFLRAAGTAGPLPTVLLVHGGPKAAWGQAFIGDAQLLSEAGFGVLLVNPRGSRGYGADFAGANTGRWGEDDYADLMAALDIAIEAGLADADRLGVAGISYGGYMSAWIVGHTRRFKAAVIENPLTNFLSMYGTSDIGLSFVTEAMDGLPPDAIASYVRCSPIMHAHHCSTPTLIIQGEADYRTRPEQSRQLYAVLKRAGCVVEMLMLPHASHDGSIDGPVPARRAQNVALVDWMQRHLRAGRAA
jgi:dipeptidyl aminopeptidase/acylaminoacyl peptidase